MYIAIVIGCFVADDPQPRDCAAAVAPVFFNSIEDCETNAVTQGQAHLNNSGRYMLDYKCVPTDLFGVGDV